MVWHQLSIFEFFLRAPILAKSVHEPFASAAMWMRHKGSNESNAASAPIRAPVSAPILYCLFANSSAKPIKYLRIAVRMRHKTFEKFNTTSASVRVLIWIQYFRYLRIVFKAVAKWLRQKVLMLHF